jgi:hypothetical protein
LGIPIIDPLNMEKVLIGWRGYAMYDDWVLYYTSFLDALFRKMITEGKNLHDARTSILTTEEPEDVIPNVERISNNLSCIGVIWEQDARFPEY